MSCKLLIPMGVKSYIKYKHVKHTNVQRLFQFRQMNTHTPQWNRKVPGIHRDVNSFTPTRTYIFTDTQLVLQINENATWTATFLDIWNDQCLHFHLQFKDLTAWWSAFKTVSNNLDVLSSANIYLFLRFILSKNYLFPVKNVFFFDEYERYEKCLYQNSSRRSIASVCIRAKPYFSSSWNLLLFALYFGSI